MFLKEDDARVGNDKGWKPQYGSREFVDGWETGYDQSWKRGWLTCQAVMVTASRRGRGKYRRASLAPDGIG